jgi:hypothetical protein
MNTKEQSFIDKSIREQQAFSWYATGKQLQGIYLYSEQTADKYAPVDNWMVSASTECFVEVKVRTQYTSEQINNWGGAYIEFTKLSGIIEYNEKLESKLPVYYFNFFKDCLEIYELNLDPTQYSWQLKYLQKDDHDKNKVWKYVAPLIQPIEKIFYK